MTRQFVRGKVERNQWRRRKGALVGAVLAVGSVSMAATALRSRRQPLSPQRPLMSGGLQAAPTLTICGASMVKSFEKSHPGDSVNIEYQSVAGEATGRSSWPGWPARSSALVISWGGGPLQEYVKAGVVQLFADPGKNDAGNPSWKSISCR